MRKEKAKKQIITTLVRCQSPLSRSEIAIRTGLQRITVTKLLSELISEGIVADSGYANSTGGRRPELVRIISQSLTSIGFEIGSDSIRSVLIGLDGGIIERVEIYGGGKDKASISPGAVVENVVSVAKRFMKVMKGKNRKAIAGIGIGIAGLVDQHNGVSIEFPQRRDWHDVALCKLVKDKINLPVFLANNVDTATLGEKWWGIGKKSENFIYLHLGPGIGMGMVFNGKIYAGANENAGELGHITMDVDGPLCYCGNYGCLETIVSEGNIVSQTLAALESNHPSPILELVGDDLSKITFPVVLEGAQHGDKIAFNVVGRAGEYLGLAIANVVNLLNPDLVIINGTFRMAGDLLLTAINRVLKKRVLTRLEKNLSLEYAQLGEWGSAIGAATLVFKEVFADD